MARVLLAQRRLAPTTLWTGLNRGFFKGTVVEDEVDAFLAQHRLSGAEGVV